RLVRVEDPISRALLQGRSKFPGKIHGVADAGVHTLPADRTVDMCGVTEQERASAAEPVGDSMLYVIRREPVHAFDVDTQPRHHAPADIVPGQIFARGGSLHFVSKGAARARA